MKYTNDEISGIENLCRFLCKHQKELHDIIMHTANDIKESSPIESDKLIMETPIIQGSKNQWDLQDIGEQETDTTKIRIGVDALLNPTNNK